MARHAADREDLYAELATALPKWELQLSGWAAAVVTGFRPGGIWSIYFGPDQVYHFDAQFRLRRAFLHEHLFRSAGTTLTQLTRERTETESLLLTRDLSPTELAEFLERLQHTISSFRQALASVNVQIIRCEPPDAPLDALHAACLQVLSAAPPLSPPLK
jgi:hypothetical protein